MSILLTDHQPINVGIYSMTGVRMHCNEHVTGNQLQINTSQLSPGNYIIVITEKTGEKYRIKMTKQ